jgi:putative transposase
MDRIPPGQGIRQKIDELLQAGWQGEEDLSTMLLRLGAQRLAQELLEQEVTDFLGRARYERVKANQDLRGYRNGYRPAHIRSAEGEIEVEVPRVRQVSQPYSSRLMAFLRGNSDVLERLVAEMYDRGISTRDIEDALYEATGDRLLTRSAESELTDVLWAEYEAFSQKDLSGFPVEYLFLDAVYESLRRLGAGPEGVLCAWAICSDGRKVLLHLALGSRESYLAWRDFLRDLVRRGRCPYPIMTR